MRQGSNWETTQTMPRRGRATRVVCSTSCASCQGKVQATGSGCSGAICCTWATARLSPPPPNSCPVPFSYDQCCVLIFGSAFGLHIKTISCVFFSFLRWHRHSSEQSVRVSAAAAPAARSAFCALPSRPRYGWWIVQVGDACLLLWQLPHCLHNQRLAPQPTQIVAQLFTWCFA